MGKQKQGNRGKRSHKRSPMQDGIARAGTDRRKNINVIRSSHGVYATVRDMMESGGVYPSKGLRRERRRPTRIVEAT